ncbi:hypothetical protein [Streptomonospora litoralis]|nr:hypothetical protein [Streptomonospora litoralis]
MSHGDDAPGTGSAPYGAERGPGEPDLDRLIADLQADRGPCSGTVSDEVRAAARAAYAMRRDDAVMSEVGTDSAESPPAGVRDSALLAEAPRYLRFDTPGATLDLEITAVGDRRTLVGRVDPPGPTSADIRTPHGSARAPVDADGAFVAPDVPTGPVSVLLHHPAAPPVATPWVTA